MQKGMNLVQSSEASKSEPIAATVPRDYNFAADILKRNLDAGRASKIVFIDHRGKYSYADLADRVERFGHVLRGLGVRSEERILICLLDTIDWPTAFLGAIKAGVVAVPVNTLMTEDDYRFMLDDSRARVLVVSEELLPKFAPAIAASKLFFAYGLGNALTFPMSAGATTVLLPARPTPDLVAGLLKQHQVTIFYAVPRGRPTVAGRLNDCPHRP